MKKLTFICLLMALCVASVIATAESPKEITDLQRFHYGGSDTDIANHVTALEDGGFLVAGCTTSNDGDISHRESTSQEYSDAWAIRLDAEGGVVWDYLTGTESLYDQFTKAVQLPQGRIGLVHFTNDNYELVILSPDGMLENSLALPTTIMDLLVTDDALVMVGMDINTVVDSSWPAFVVKMSLEGEILWQHTFTELYDEQYPSIAKADGGYLLGGYFRSKEPLAIVPLISKIDEDGMVIWKQKGKIEADMVRGIADVAVTKSGGALGVGHLFSFSGMNDEALAIVTDQSGNELQNVSITTPSYGSFNSLLSLKDGTFLAAGHTLAPAGTLGTLSAGWLAQLDENAAVLAEGYIENEFDQGGLVSGLVQAADGAIYLYGVGHGNGADAVLIRLDFPK